MSSMIGFECIFADTYDIWKFLKTDELDINSYCVISDDMLIIPSGLMTPVVMPEKFDKEFCNDMLDYKCVCERLVLYLYPNSATEYADIAVYDDYVHSQCEIVILAYDAYYLEIYCKNSNRLKIILQKAIEFPNTKINEKYLDSDGRTGMYV